MKPIEELKPCPFCGGEAELKDLGVGTGGWYVKCNTRYCGSTMWGTPVDGTKVSLDSNAVYDQSKINAIKWWNTRNPDAEEAINRQGEKSIELFKLVLRKFYFEDEASIGFVELGGKIKDHLCEMIGDEEFCKFTESIDES